MRPFDVEIMYGVLYAASSEVFPSKHRDTGTGSRRPQTAFLASWRVPFPETNFLPRLSTDHAAHLLMIDAGGLALLLPFEPQGKASI
jgi:hypothetical protein